MKWYAYIDKPLDKVPLPKTIKLGFIYFTSEWNVMDYIVGKKDLRQYAVYWSNSANVADHLYRYQVN